VLTSLIDVIFLLLVFFMLSSQIAPYSLISVSGGTSSQADTPTEAPIAAQQSDAANLLFIVSRGHIKAGSATIPLDQLPKALNRFGEETPPNATLLTTKSATVQDIVTALEIFQTSRFATVRLVMTPS